MNGEREGKNLVDTMECTQTHIKNNVDENADGKEERKKNLTNIV